MATASKKPAPKRAPAKKAVAKKATPKKAAAKKKTPLKKSSAKKATSSKALKKVAKKAVKPSTKKSTDTSTAKTKTSASGKAAVKAKKAATKKKAVLAGKKTAAKKVSSKKVAAKKVAAKTSTVKKVVDTSKPVLAEKRAQNKEKTPSAQSGKPINRKKKVVNLDVVDKPNANSAAPQVKQRKLSAVGDRTGDVAKLDLAYIGSKDESAESRNVASRERVRSSLQSEIEAFLSGGGQIAEIEPNVMADPPKKPESNYGSRPI